MLQWGNEGNFSLYGKNLPNTNTGLLMLLSLIGGLVLPWLLKALVRGLAAIRRVRKSAKNAKSA